jgi:hypothetical protein
LEQDYNSLHAQREACEAFIRSQAGEGWRLVKTAYDDGGFSGAGMERPGLQQLLSNIREGSLRRGADGLLFHGRYRLIGLAVLIDQHSRWTCQFRARIEFAGSLGTAPTETFSGSMRHRKARAHAWISIDSPKAAKFTD